jgi:hypothetical protein
MDTLVTLDVVDSLEGIELEELDAEVGEVVTAVLLDVMLTAVVGVVVGPELVDVEVKE